MFYAPRNFYDDNLSRGHIRADVAEKIVPKLRQDAPEPTLEALGRLSCEVCGVARLDFLSARRWAPYVRARHIYFALAKEFTSKSYPQIGRHCGGKDHTTVMHGHKKVAKHPAYYEPELSQCREAVRAWVVA